MSYLYHTFFYNPLYNGLVFLIDVLPAWVDVGIAIVIFTVLVKLILYPLSKAAIKSQIAMKELQPKMGEIKRKYSDKTQQSMETMKLYKEAGVNPFSGIFVLIIQIPIILALYKIFLSGGLPNISADLLYSFVNVPETINMHFLGIDLIKKSLILALLAGISQYFQIKFSIPEIKKTFANVGSASFSDDLTRMMSVQMKYVLPVVVFFASYGVNAAIAIYWTTSNLFAIGQELVVRRKLIKK